MKRQADSTIKGFLYQFNKSILSILESDQQAKITLEGIFEDIDIEGENAEDLIAIQCKYHEAADKFVLSIVYKPILLMLESFSNGNTSIQYMIYIHIPSEPNRTKKLIASELEQIISTTDEELKKITNRITKPYDKDKFLEHVSITFGPSLEELERSVKEKLVSIYEAGVDIDGLIYPNAMNDVITISAKRDLASRIITKKAFIENLRNRSNFVFSKWIRYTRSRNKALNLLKAELNSRLSLNSSLRYFYLNPECISEFDEKIVLFMINYLNKYHYKIVHTNPPLFVIKGDDNYINQIVKRLYSNGIRTNNGVVGNSFIVDEIVRDPFQSRHKKPENADFRLRITSENNFADILTKRKPDQLYIISDVKLGCEIPVDINAINISVDNFVDLEYILYLGGIPNERF